MTRLITVVGPLGLEPTTYKLKHDRVERCADEGNAGQR
jgi:hypothetical protein